LLVDLPGATWRIRYFKFGGGGCGQMSEIPGNAEVKDPSVPGTLTVAFNVCTEGIFR
jgi:hypothetical protein